MLSPFMLRRYFALGRYDVLAVTDHDRFTAPLAEPDPRGGNVLVLPGAELSLRAPVSGGPLHVVAIGIRGMPDVSTSSSFGEALDAITAAGGLAVLAHPWWSGLLPNELPAEDLRRLTALEVFNSGCEVEQGRGDSALYWDALLANDVRVNAVANDDHHLPGFDTFRSWTMVRAEERTVDGVLTALREGAFYSTCGPEIRDMRVDESGLTVETSPAHAIAVVAQPPFGARVAAGAHALSLWGETPLSPAGWREGVIDGDLLTSAHFPRVRGASYVRVTVTDALGRQAWSNPIWFDDNVPARE
jgi:hypothetical protein